MVPEIPKADKHIDISAAESELETKNPTRPAPADAETTENIGLFLATSIRGNEVMIGKYELFSRIRLFGHELVGR